MDHALIVLGTRPEAIKLAPVITALKKHQGVRVTVCATGQHREQLDQVLSCFSIRPEIDLQIMTPGQSPSYVLSRAIARLDDLLLELAPDCLIVQGDTTSAFAGAIAAFHRNIPVAHVEAGLRTGDIRRPFPEEANRRMIAAIADLHFAPTTLAADNLLAEGVSEHKVIVTGNTVVDAIHHILETQPASAEFTDASDETKHLAVVTLHRRESLGLPLRGLCEALNRVALRHRDWQFVFPVHKNPAVRETVMPLLADAPNVALIDPLDYVNFAHLLRRSDLVVTDSGGIQEESAVLGKRVLIARDVTERPEVVDSGWGQIVGTDQERFESILEQELTGDPAAGRPEGRRNVFGDGQSGKRIANLLTHLVPRRKRGRSLCIRKR